MKHIDIRDLQQNPAYRGTEVTVCGWVRTSRDSKNVAFLELNDGTTLKHLQVVLDKETLPDVSAYMPLGTSLKVVGTLVESERNGVEVNAREVTVLGVCPSEYPLQKKRHSVEYLRTIPHLRVRTNMFNAIFRVRSVMAAAIHRYFQERNYVYVNTPLITASDCEGAGEMFKVTTIGYSDQYKSAEEYYRNDFFGRRAGLSVSGQLEGEMAATALGKIYTFGPSFRAENSNKLRSVVDNDFQILDYTDAIALLEKADAEFKYPVYWGCDLQTEHERYITEQVFKKPVFVINYPKEIKSFYMKQNPDGKTVAATDLLVPGVGEIIGCSEREADLDKLLEAMQARHMSLEEYQDYLDLRRFGTVPHSGFGLGFERIIMYVTGVSNIRDVQLFPRTVGSIR